MLISIQFIMNPKVVLSAIALFAIIGGTLAFKAQRTPHTFFKKNTTTTVTADQICTLPVNVLYTTRIQDATGDPILQTLYATTTAAGDCPQLLIYPAD